VWHEDTLRKLMALEVSVRKAEAEINISSLNGHH
jgi:hypothetical protein